jgi:hypothetical protein
MRRVFLLLAITVVIGACNTDPEATRLRLQTAPELPQRACEGALATPFRIGRDGDEMVFVDVGTGDRRSVVWPSGFAAWVEFGTAVLYASDGSVVGREGEVLDKIGGAGVEGEGFHVCSVGVRTYQ